MNFTSKNNVKKTAINVHKNMQSLIGNTKHEFHESRSAGRNSIGGTRINIRVYLVYDLFRHSGVRGPKFCEIKRVQTKCKSLQTKKFFLPRTMKISSNAYGHKSCLNLECCM
jgi:hypothetical protein